MTTKRGRATPPLAGERSTHILRLCMLALVGLAFTLMSATAFGQFPVTPPPPALKKIPVPGPSDAVLKEFIRDRKAAIVLGKALFWDMQVGTEGTQACGSCHFHAGADNRIKNPVAPGLNGGDSTFQIGGPNTTLKPSDFPFHRMADVNNRESNILFDANDICGSQGVFHSQFLKVINGQAKDITAPLDDIFKVKNTLTRRVEPRNTPTMINAVFNHDNFWDGRAHFFFNGNNPFGPFDVNSGILVNGASGLYKKRIMIPYSSLASQAVGPPVNPFEMSSENRTFRDVGRKLLSLRPLNKQLVHPHDSVLGPYSRATLANGKAAGLPGLNVSYATLVQAAFQPSLWNGKQCVRMNKGAPYEYPHGSHPTWWEYQYRWNSEYYNRAPNPAWPNEYSQMEMNFALFFGLAVQMYEATLVADETPFDKHQGWDGHPADPAAMTDAQKRGMNIFFSNTCQFCHTGSNFTVASVDQIENGSLAFAPGVRANVAANGGRLQVTDTGSFFLTVRPFAEDIGKGATAPFINPLTGKEFPLSYTAIVDLAASTDPPVNPNDPAVVGRTGLVPKEVWKFFDNNPNLPLGTPLLNLPPDGAPVQRLLNGVFKTPSLRNSELTGPYWHNGGFATLRHVIDTYNRGLDFQVERNPDGSVKRDANGNAILNPDGDVLMFPLGLTDQQKSDLVSFLTALTDDRVRQEKGPFDHPQIFVPHGLKGDATKILGSEALDRLGFKLSEAVEERTATGKNGRAAAGLPPIGHFLNLDPNVADTSNIPAPTVLEP